MEKQTNKLKNPLSSTEGEDQKKLQYCGDEIH